MHPSAIDVESNRGSILYWRRPATDLRESSQLDYFQNVRGFSPQLSAYGAIYLLEADLGYGGTVPGMVSDIVSKVSIYRNIGPSVHRNSARVKLSIPWYPRACFQILNESFDISNIEFVLISFFVYRVS